MGGSILASKGRSPRHSPGLVLYFYFVQFFDFGSHLEMLMDHLLMNILHLGISFGSFLGTI